MPPHLHDEHQAEDAFQAAFLVLVRKAGSIGKHQSVASWLYKVTYRIASQLRIRSAKRLEQRAEVADLDALPDRTPANDLIWRELRPMLDEEISRLPEKFRSAIVLCYVQGHRTEEAADLLGCPKSTLLSRLSAARELLRSRLLRRGLALSASGLAAQLSVKLSSAAVPRGLNVATVRAAMGFAAGNAAGGLVSSSVVVLTQGVLRAMFFSKLANAAVIVFALAFLGLGSGLVAQWAGHDPHGQGETAYRQPLTLPRKKGKANRKKIEEFLATIKSVDGDTFAGQ